jgi:hypothetical protein
MFMVTEMDSEARNAAFAVAKARKQWRSEISTEVGLLRADLTIEKAAERREYDGVVELPSFIERRRHG